MSRVFEENAKRDAVLLKTALDLGREACVPLAIALGWTPDELFVDYAKWITTQPESYRAKVVAELEVMDRSDAPSTD